MRWDGERKRLAVTADDTLLKVFSPIKVNDERHFFLYSYPVLKVVEVRSGGGIVEVYKDARHTDFVRGLAWKEDTLWYLCHF